MNADVRMRILSNLRKAFPGRQAGSERLPFPAGPGKRIAQLGSGQSFAEVELFSENNWNQVQAFGPNILVAPTFELQSWMRTLKRSTRWWHSLNTAVFVLSMQGVGSVDDEVRQTVWNSFGVPTYELFVGPTGRVLASECEAHSGWHVQPGVAAEIIEDQLIFRHRTNAIATGLSGHIVESVCACGSAQTLVDGIALQQKRRLSVAKAASVPYAATA